MIEETRIPPQSLEAEQSVLGAMIIDKNAIVKVSEILSAEDFYRESHKCIFGSIMKIYTRNEPVDFVTLVNELKKENKLEDVGGIAYITMLGNHVPTAVNVKQHAEIVAEKSILRQLVNVASIISELGYEGEENAHLLVDKAEQLVHGIANKKKSGEFKAISEILMKSVQVLERLINNKGGITGLSTGFNDLDKLTSGLHNSDFIILAARPSMGKTAFALNLVQNVALRAHKKRDGKAPCSVAFFSLEMSSEQLVNRMICAEASIDSQKMKIGAITDTDWEALWKVCEDFSKAKIFIDDTPGITVMEMRSRARRLKSEHGLDLIVVDYLQLMQGSGKKNSSGDRQQEVSEISRSLKALARELDVPVIALSQLSRSVETRQVKRPMLSDLRESGSLEQDADIVAFLYRDDYYNPDSDTPNLTELIIAKHRNGPVDTVNLFFQKQFTKFVGYSSLEKTD